jgi:hypothetical protein
MSLKAGSRECDVRFGSKADICGVTSHVRFTPNSDHTSRHAANGHVWFYPRKRTCAVHVPASALGQKRTLIYSITSSAIVSTVGRTSIPSVRAV